MSRPVRVRTVTASTRCKRAPAIELRLAHQVRSDRRWLLLASIRAKTGTAIRRCAIGADSLEIALVLHVAASVADVADVGQSNLWALQSVHVGIGSVVVILEARHAVLAVRASRWCSPTLRNRRFG